VPLAMAGPGIRTGKDDRLVTHTDFAPTLLHLAGTTVPDDIDGRSMLPLLRDRTGPWRTDFLSEFHGDYRAFVCPSVRVADAQNAIAAGWFMSFVPVTGTLVPTIGPYEARSGCTSSGMPATSTSTSSTTCGPIPISSRTFGHARGRSPAHNDHGCPPSPTPNPRFRRGVSCR
jgi:hypothetical protein